MKREQNAILKSVKAASALMSQQKAIKDDLSQKLSLVMSRIMPDGHVISFDQKSLAEFPWLRHAKTIAGDDKGAVKFKVIGSVTVEPNLSNIGGSKWYCEVEPVTSKESTSGKKVKLSGNLVPMTLFDDTDDISGLMLLMNFPVKRKRKSPVQ